MMEELIYRFIIPSKNYLIELSLDASFYWVVPGFFSCVALYSLTNLSKT